MKQSLLASLTVASVLMLASCGSIKIGRILDNPTRYQDRSVSIEGTVTNSFGAFVAGGYQVQDDTGQILVLASGSVPRKGVRVKVDGRVQSGVTFMGRSYGTTIRERDHKVKY
ncbi:MAG: hypothetical protein HUU41_11715 [Bryobacteraceae bacterium]|nr:hypothetical protein [Bryobacterales bacterium]MDL1891162.1 hypothetical protein [Nitrospirales bacterium NOB]MEB2359930.1 hypothetical protein [Bryobacterales bacterium]NUN01773.1 hypothetical protein [Bryobacteraceae bacterium]